jgi:hypothetical protein
MQTHKLEPKRVFILKVVFTGLLLTYAMLFEARYMEPMLRLNAESTYSPEPTYGVIQLQEGADMRREFRLKKKHAIEEVFGTTLQKKAADRRARREKKD